MDPTMSAVEGVADGPNHRGVWPVTGAKPPGSRPLVVVLGASGFVGSAVTAALAGRPVRLRTVARRRAAVPAGAVAEIESVGVDLTVGGAVGEAVAGADAVIHLVLHSGGWRGADQDPDSERTNVGVVRELVRALRGSRRPRPVVVFAGSTSQVGLPPRLPIDGTEVDHPVTAYDRQKQAAEKLLLAATAGGSLRGVSLRLPTIFGPVPTPAAVEGHPTVTTPARGVVAAMARQALAGQPLTMWADGAIERDLLYVDDAAEAFATALSRADDLAGRHWLLGTGNGVRLRDLFPMIAELVAEHTGQPAVPVVSAPPPPGAAPTDGHSVVVDSSAFRSATGWRSTVPLREGLRRTVTALAASGSGPGRLPQDAQ
jgi:nucleoside-diphosphate-sugar epimerase